MYSVDEWWELKEDRHRAHMIKKVWGRDSGEFWTSPAMPTPSLSAKHMVCFTKTWPPHLYLIFPGFAWLPFLSPQRRKCPHFPFADHSTNLPSIPSPLLPLYQGLPNNIPVLWKHLKSVATVQWSFFFFFPVPCYFLALSLTLWLCAWWNENNNNN